MQIQRRTLILAPLTFAGAALAQQEKQRYLSVTLYRVHSGKWGEFRADAEGNTPKIMKGFMGAGMPIAGWSVSQVLYPGVDPDAHNAALGVSYDGPPSNPGTDLGPVYQKAVGMGQSQYFEKMNPIRAIVGRMLWRRIASAPGTKPATVNGVYLWKTQAFKDDEVDARFREIMQPIAAQRVADGNISYFSAWRLVAPAGSQAPYDVMAVYGHKDLASAVEPKGTGEEAFHKAHPGKNYVQHINAIRETMTLYRRNLNSILASGERA